VAGPTRRDTFRVTLSIRGLDGVHHDFGVWDKKSGGAIDSDIYKYKPGGMAKQVSLGGSKTIEDLTVSRLYRHMRDHLQLQNLINWTGKARVTVSQHVLDTDGNLFGAPIVWTGLLKTTTPPDHDSESTDPAMIELVISPDGDPHAT
jgi:hypothetical protein